jgi:hypothetical protein
MIVAVIYTRDISKEALIRVTKLDIRGHHRLKSITFNRIKQIPKDSTVALAAIISSVPFIFLTLFFVSNERSLRASSQYGVLEFELAWTPKMMDKIFAAWGPANVEYQRYVHHVDYLYLVVYALFGLLCILLLARRLEGKLQRAGFFFVLAPVLAAVFDAMENVFLLSMLTRGAPGGRSDPALASLCATFKIAFIGATIGFIFIAGALLLARRFRVKDVYYYLALIVYGALLVWVLLLWNVYLCYVIGPVYLAIAALFIWVSSRGTVSRETATPDVTSSGNPSPAD